jgi:hypothetical protein
LEDLIAEIGLQYVGFARQTLNKKQAALDCLEIRSQVRSQKFMLDDHFSYELANFGASSMFGHTRDMRVPLALYLA